MPEYGAGSRHFNFVFCILVYLKARTAIDYGCGKGVLAEQVSRIPHLECAKYDPAIPEHDLKPEAKFDCLVNTDVLEHIPEGELDATLRDFPEISNQAIVIPHLRKAKQILPNGENAHCTLKSPEQWREVLGKYYKNVVLLPHESERHALLLCTQTQIDYEPLESALQLIADRMSDRMLVQARLDDSLMQRVRRSGKLLLGPRALK